MLRIGVIFLLFHSIVIGNPVQGRFKFLVKILIGAYGFSNSPTMISSIAAKASNSSTLMAVLSFPVIIPMLLMLMKLSKNAIDGLDRSVSLDELFTLLGINLIVVSVSYILFPYLWRS